MSEPNDLTITQFTPVDANGTFVATITGSTPGTRTLAANLVIHGQAHPLPQRALLNVVAGTVGTGTTTSTGLTAGTTTAGTTTAGTTTAGTTTAGTTTAGTTTAGTTTAGTTTAGTTTGSTTAGTTTGGSSTTTTGGGGPGPAAQVVSTPGANNGSATADGVTDIVVTTTVTDAFGAPVVGVTVTATGPAAVGFSPLSGLTDTNGEFITTVTSTQSGGQSITLTTDNGLFSSSTLTFVPGPTAAAQSTFTAAPSPRVADNVQAATLTITARDAYSNPVPSASVTFQSNGTGNTLAPTTGPTDTSGASRRR